MSKVEIEELVEALNFVIKSFKDAIKPYAIELIKELINAYKRMT